MHDIFATIGFMTLVGSFVAVVVFGIKAFFDLYDTKKAVDKFLFDEKHTIVARLNVLARDVDKLMSESKIKIEPKK